MNRIPLSTSQPAPAKPQRKRSSGMEDFVRYWRLHDPFCRSFLQLGTNPQDFAAVKLAFPFVREACILEAPHNSSSNVTDWLTFAFLAGHTLGCKRPDLIEEILPGYELPLAQCRQELICTLSKADLLTIMGLDRTFTAIVAEQIEKKPTDARLPIFAELLLKSVRSGFYASAIGVHDPVFSNFLALFQEPMLSELPGILERRLAASVWRDLEDGRKKPWHPVMRLARELYPEHSLEGKAILRFLDEHLHQLAGHIRENWELNDEILLDWLDAGLQYGFRLKCDQPRLVARIFRECAGARLEASRSVVSKVVSKAKSLKPAALLGPLREWRQAVYPTTSSFPGQRLAEVAYFADFVVWIAWLDGERHRGIGRRAKGGRQ